MSDLIRAAQYAEKRIKELEGHLDWVVEGLSMIEDGEASNPKEFARNMIRVSAHLSDFAMKTSIALDKNRATK